ncbi:MAG TPA: hypothetical protein PKG48_12110 [Bacteroidales bacterium]|mgnify:CR=1 FL=1|nr:hypothetical protein [Bacteroidales bacterium]HPS63094.1 hypothetical protein [Bacteroidales bacterium]
MPILPGHPENIIQAITDKGSLKQEVYHQTLETFNLFKAESEKFIRQNKAKIKKSPYPVLFEFQDRSMFEFQVKFGSDILIFFMHTNVFEIPRDHLVMKSGYIREDKRRSYCGIVHIFNFLADSFKYNRVNDVGYCIGRIFINRENHYFTEGKKEIGLLFNNFSENTLDVKAVRNLLKSAILYTLNFDLLTPPFDNIKEVTVAEMQTTLDNVSLRTGKRLGFRFQADVE